MRRQRKQNPATEEVMEAEMRNGWIKIVGIAAVVIFLMSGIAFADGCDRGRHHGHYQHHGWYGHPRGHGDHHYRPHPPVVVQRYYPAPPPVYYPAPGTYFGMSVSQPGVSFGFGISN
jgi:hypothetical protein